MDFNLITKRWIPVRQRDGTKITIAPWEITKDYKSNPIVSIDAVRPDFNGALIQFFIGLFQTAAAPVDDTEWEEYFSDPPEPEKLKSNFSGIVSAFNFDADACRFMQDKEELAGEDWSIGSLLMDEPGGNTLKNNLDHFVKRGGIQTICPSCCATALYTMQLNAPAGGVGYRTSLRGGGPLTTLVLSDDGDDATLWQLIWLNVLEKNIFNTLSGDKAKNDMADIFPWRGKTRTSENAGGCETTPTDANPAQMFWGMPRRIRLNLDSTEEGTCDLCGQFSTEGISTFRTKNYGVNYTGPWKHPLSPHSKDKEGISFPIHAQPGGISYRHWLGLILLDSKVGREPAYVVYHFLENRHIKGKQFRLWTFGYDMDKMKARCWYESTMPLISMPSHIRKQYEGNIASLIMAASEIAGNLRTCVKKAWFKRPADAKGDVSFIDREFWQTTENDFYATLKTIKNLLEKKEEVVEANTLWHKNLCLMAEKIFNRLAWEGPVKDADPKRVVLASRDLVKFNYSKKIRIDLLGLPETKERRKKA